MPGSERKAGVGDQMLLQHTVTVTLPHCGCSSLCDDKETQREVVHLLQKFCCGVGGGSEFGIAFRSGPSSDVLVFNEIRHLGGIYS